MYYVNSNIKNLHRVDYKGDRKDFLKLDMNENPEGLPKQFFDNVMKTITPEYIATYPQSDALIKEISRITGCGAEQICVTNGSDDAIRLCFEVFGQSSKKKVSVSPSFEMYSVYNNMYGMIHVPVEYDNNFEISSEVFINSIDEQTGMVVILNPNSPIGRPWTKVEIEKIIQKARIYHLIVIIDEAYHYFYPISFLEFVNQYDNVIIIRTFSKLLSIAGCRVGYVISNSKIIDFLKRASSTYPVNCVGLRFAEMILKDEQLIDTLIKTELEGRTYLLQQLTTKEYKHYHNGANYVFIKPNKEPQAVFQKLKEEKILIKTYNNTLLKDWIRITTGSIESMRTFWNAFGKIDDLA